jgi:hypothetical protein
MTPLQGTPTQRWARELTNQQLASNLDVLNRQGALNAEEKKAVLAEAARRLRWA